MNRQIPIVHQAQAATRSLKVLFTLAAVLAVAGALITAHMLREGALWGKAAHPGEAVAVPGGLLRVDKVIPEHMAPMPMQQLTQTGANMSATGMDMAPEGYRRFTVYVSLSGQSPNGLQYSQDTFEVRGEGVQAIKPLRAELGSGLVPQGSQVRISLTFQVPEAARQVLLTMRGGERPIALELEPSDHHHDHGQAPGAGQDEEHHDHHEEHVPHNHEEHEH